ncbi:MAG: energy transducer TonB, partial [Magnetospirillum sp.]|nr:energy transducer TonB [Magnetospirillum sp.]
MIGEVRLVPPLSWRRDRRGAVLAGGLHGGLIVLALAGLSAGPPKVPMPAPHSMVVELVPMPQPTQPPQAAPAPLPVAAPQSPPATPKVTVKSVTKKAAPATKPAATAMDDAPAATDSTSPASGSGPVAPSDQGKTMEQTEVFVAPQSNVEGLDNPRPPYPTLARRRGWEGLVVLLVWVNELGLAQSVALHQSSGHDILDQSALNTVKS